MAKILVVDNDATTVSLLKILLELDGHAVLDCGLAVHVLETVAREKPDLILMDVFLTGGDGLVLLRQIRANPATAGVPVVMTSGMELSEQCAQAGANDFLLKPYTPEQLATTMNHCLDHPRDPDAPAAAP
jgi:two-component system alkaline phosphatase synthesis response regulator PhoP